MVVDASNRQSVPVEPELTPQEPAKKPKGSRNLMILSIGAVIITVITTGASLWIYRSTGDIYLDRSRPGYLPDEEEVDKNVKVNTNFSYSDSGALDSDELKDYLKELKVLNDRLRALADPYSATPLSDESLGIKPVEETSPSHQPTKR